MGKYLDSELNDGVSQPLNCSFLCVINGGPSGECATNVLVRLQKQSCILNNNTMLQMVTVVSVHYQDLTNATF